MSIEGEEGMYSIGETAIIPVLFFDESYSLMDPVELEGECVTLTMYRLDAAPSVAKFIDDFRWIHTGAAGLYDLEVIVEENILSGGDYYIGATRYDVGIYALKVKPRLPGTYYIVVEAHASGLASECVLQTFTVRFIEKRDPSLLLME